MHGNIGKKGMYGRMHVYKQSQHPCMSGAGSAASTAIVVCYYKNAVISLQYGEICDKIKCDNLEQ